MSQKEIKLMDMRPYILRMWWQYLEAQDLDPQILVQVGDDLKVNVPRQYVKNGVITLKLCLRSVRDLQLGDEQVTFYTRFAGKDTYCFVPIDNIRMINSAVAPQLGCGFPPVELFQEGVAGVAQDNSGTKPEPPEPPKPPRRNHLRVVK